MPSKLQNNKLPAIAVLCSGEGTNLQAIINAAKSGKISARVAIVVSDKARANALNRAKRVGAETHFLNPKLFSSRAAYDRALISILSKNKVKIVCLAGFMRILSPLFVRRYKGKILNIHPALLPSFPGANAVSDALKWGAKVTGVTVHIVDEEVDHGPIVLQETVAISSKDTKNSLLLRVHKVEHKIYPKAIGLMLNGRVRVSSRKTSIR